MEAVRWLREAGFSVTERATVSVTDAVADTLLEVRAGDRMALFVVQQKSRAPYPGEIGGLRRPGKLPGRQTQPLLVVPFVSEALGARLTEAGWSWADAVGDFDLRAHGMVLRQRRIWSPPVPKRRTLPQGSGSFAVIRALIGLPGDERDGCSVTALAAQVGVSQPRASQVLSRLESLELVEKAGRRSWRPRREELLDRFLAEYPGPGGSQLYFYSLDAPAQVAAQAASFSSPQRRVALSADVGPDLIRPWRRPSVVIIYTSHLVDLGLVEASGMADANVIVRMPQDKSVFPEDEMLAEMNGAAIPLADPVQMIWDLQDLGGTDRFEAAEKMRQWLLTRPSTDSFLRQGQSRTTWVMSP